MLKINLLVVGLHNIELFKIVKDRGIKICFDATILAEMGVLTAAV
jgi:hypothetical protein